MTNPWLRAALACVLAACAAPAPNSATLPNAPSKELRPFETAGSLHWLSASGIGYAKVSCGTGWTAILGGVYSAKAGDVGTGFPGSDGSSWVGESASYDLLATYALCAPTYESSGYFDRVVASPASKSKTSATAACPNGGMLLQGWASNAKYEGAEVRNGKPVGWTAGGSPGVVASAECATAQEASLSLAWVSRSGASIYVACDGDPDDVIGGFFGEATLGGGPAPPERAFPSNGGTGSTQPLGFSFLSKTGSTAWVVCQND
ncbi:MAG: hypothetical protein JO029_06830 [Candidatus Eremiobacteraeota bacterium]|nr:hypothetical protein [Candidatus Eremiobacteraeota bacterium]MBV8433973.1 hypothetical protein [Candidatus Eremiobacteraeota bacterium]MBV8584358.1 hypothetical protein [Candidatus Eremiobacteraeota bacterium]